LERKVTRGVIAEIQLPRDASLLAGKVREELGELHGRAHIAAMPWESGDDTSDRVKAEWVVKAKKGSKVKLTAHHERGGGIHTEVALQ
ncbi:MAG TPA: hypothetical protein PK078_14780, partial [Anaerolineales bacterium]|nr:hypothetical protein [Anaerolineales bacterium]